MKNFVIAVILTAALIALFSWIDYRQQMFDCVNYWQQTEPTGNGSGTKRKGDSGLIIPGDGEEMANASIEPGSIPELPVETEATEKFAHTSVKSVCENYDQNQQEITEEYNNMNILEFWHGVAAVLIGEASALMVAFAWMKIRGKNDG